MTVKEAAQNLLNRSEISQEEYDLVKDVDREGLAKVAFVFAKGGVLTGAGGVAQSILQTAALGALVASLGGDLYSKIKRKSDQASAFEGMLSKKPELKEYPKEKVKDYFDVVKTFSPKSASNPLVAADLVNKMVQFGGVDHKLIQDLSNIEGPTPSVLQDMTSSAAKSLVAFPKSTETE